MGLVESFSTLPKTVKGKGERGFRMPGVASVWFHPSYPLSECLPLEGGRIGLPCSFFSLFPEETESQKQILTF